MTAHIVLPPRPVPFSACWLTECTCGHTAITETAEQARDGMTGCRQAERERMGGVYDRERDEAKRRRQAARRDSRRTAARTGKSEVERPRAK